MTQSLLEEIYGKTYGKAMLDVSGNTIANIECCKHLDAEAEQLRIKYCNKLNCNITITANQFYASLAIVRKDIKTTYLCFVEIVDSKCRIYFDSIDVIAQAIFDLNLPNNNIIYCHINHVFEILDYFLQYIDEHRILIDLLLYVDNATVYFACHQKIIDFAESHTAETTKLIADFKNLMYIMQACNL